MLIAHLSDIHLLSARGLRPWHLLGKRLTGSFNLYVRRARRHRLEVVEEALGRIEELGVDHVVVTGDLTNLAIDAEFRLVHRLLISLVGGPDRLSVVPGNHDRYTLDSIWLRHFERHFAEHLASDLPDLPRRGLWPTVRLKGDVAIVGVNSAIPLPPFLCGGFVGKRQADCLLAALEHPEVAGRFRVVLIHHPLFTDHPAAVDLVRGLVDARRVIGRLVEGRADLVLHGHNHSYGHQVVPHRGGEGATLVCEAGSSSLATFRDEHLGGKFNVYRIEGGRLLGYDTHLYVEGEGFGVWKTWEMADGAPREVDRSAVGG